MPVSQNGYSAGIAKLIHTVTVPGTTVRLPVRVGAAGDLLIWAAERFHREVEPLHDGWCWGYAYRDIRGATQLSNHASGTAIDLNAPAHPLGTNPTANYTAAKIAAIRRIIADSQGALRWGGDYTGRKDGMHIEVNASEVVCARVLAAVSGSTPAAPEGGDVQLPTLKEGDGRKNDGLTGAADRGHLHWWVLSAQALCNVRGLSKPLVQDGVFGPTTTAMVKELQTRNHLTADGIVGPATWGWLLGNDAPDYA